METSYLKAHPFGNRYSEWMPNLHSDCCWDSNSCARGSHGPPKAQAVTLSHGSPMQIFTCTQEVPSITLHTRAIIAKWYLNILELLRVCVINCCRFTNPQPHAMQSRNFGRSKLHQQGVELHLVLESIARCRCNN